MNPGPKINRLKQLRDKRLRRQREVDEIKREEKDIEAELVEHLQKQGLFKAAATKATFSFKSVLVAQVTDWDAVYKWIKRTNNFELLQRRITDTTYRALLEDNKKPAGIDPVNVIKTHLHTL